MYTNSSICTVISTFINDTRTIFLSNVALLNAVNAIKEVEDLHC